MERLDYDKREEDVVIRSRAGIAVYVNPNDDIVIRQDGGFNDDAIIIVQSQDLDALIVALRNLAG